MSRSLIIFVSTLFLSSLSGQGYPTHHIVSPSADILPAFSLNVQGGFSDIVGRTGWNPSAQIGIAGLVEFEWAKQTYYSDLSEGDPSIPTAGLKFRLPKFANRLDWAVSFYNAQKWKANQSQVFALAANADYAKANISTIDFESISSRVDLLVALSIGRRLRLFPSIYFLESKTRDLYVYGGDETWENGPISSTGVSKQSLLGGGFGITFQQDEDLLCIAQIITAPQHELDVEEYKMVLDHRIIFAAGTRYKLGRMLVLDTGVYSDASQPSLSDVQLYMKLNLGIGPALISGLKTKN